MAKITLKGNPINTCGKLPEIGSKAPDFVLTKSDLSDVRPTDLIGKNVILSIFPSIDTGVCAASVRRFNQEATKLNNTIVLAVSLDLPFAHSRFCSAEGIANVITASELRNRDFGDNYGVRIVDGPLAGLLARAIVAIDTYGKVVYTQMVPEIAQEPDYDAVLLFLHSSGN